MRTTILSIVLLLLAQFTVAQIVIGNLNPTSSETITKLQTDYIELAEHPDTTIWSLPSDINKVEDYSVHFIVRTDSTYDRIDGGDIYHYLSRGDSLIFLGFENRRSSVVLSTPIVDIVCPASLGDSVYNTFEGYILHANQLQLNIKGSAYTVVDGIGWLTDGSVMVDSIVSVHRHIEFSKALQDSLCANMSEDNIVIDKYALYRVGQIHPLLESKLTRKIQDEEEIILMEASFLYFPQDMPIKTEQNIISNSDTLHIDYSATLSSDLQNVQISAITNIDCDAYITAYDIFGHNLALSKVHLTANSTSDLILPLLARPVGRMLFVSIVAGESHWTNKTTINPY